MKEKIEELKQERSELKKMLSETSAIIENIELVRDWIQAKMFQLTNNINNLERELLGDKEYEKKKRREDKAFAKERQEKREA